MKVPGFLDSITNILLIAIIAGVLVPQVEVFKAYTSPLLLLIMYLTCLGIDLGKLWRVSWEGAGNIAAKLLAQFILLPTVTYLLLSGLPKELLAGSLVVAASPPAMALAFVVLKMGGNQNLALALTVVSSLLVPFLLPPMLYILLGSAAHVDVFAMFQSLCFYIFVPLLLANLTGRLGKAKESILKHSHIPSMLSLSLIISALVASAVRQISWTNDIIILVLFIFVLTAFSYVAGYALPQKQKEDRITMALGIAYNNGVLGIVTASDNFGALAAMPMILNVILSNLMLLPFSWFLKQKR